MRGEETGGHHRRLTVEDDVGQLPDQRRMRDDEEHLNRCTTGSTRRVCVQAEGLEQTCQGFPGRLPFFYPIYRSTGRTFLHAI